MSQIKIEEVSSNFMDDAVRLATEVFTNEQNIPEKLIPINEDLSPIWWCARVEEDIVGVIASWTENNQWHLGRFAVDRRLRGLGIGKKMITFSLNEIFNLGAEKVFIEARDITIRILEQFGCKVVGKSMDFYGEPVTPGTIKKCDFINNSEVIF